MASANRFCIWTMQRSGGTVFANLLSELHGHAVQHEPFNMARLWGDILKEHSEAETPLHQLLLERREEISGFNIKHCYELIPHKLNKALFTHLSEWGYVHIFLQRKDEAKRIESLVLANATGAFGAKSARSIYPDILSGAVKLDSVDVEGACERVVRCADRTAQVRDMIGNSFAAEVEYESFYRGGARDVAERFMGLRDLLTEAGLEFLGAQTHSEIEAKIENGYQGSVNVADYVPNIAELRAALRKATEGC